jgi:hypothetical protein
MQLYNFILLPKQTHHIVPEIHSYRLTLPFEERVRQGGLRVYVSSETRREYVLLKIRHASMEELT